MWWVYLEIQRKSLKKENPPFGVGFPSLYDDR
jgi:hypothetical protein